MRRPIVPYQNLDAIVENNLRNIPIISSKPVTAVDDSVMPSCLLFDRSDFSGSSESIMRSEIMERLLYHQASLSATAESMNGLIELRVNPMDTQRALQMLKNSFKSFPEHASLCNCIGEVMGQAGDAAGAMVEFRRSYLLCPNNPMPLLNAARVYQQLGQSVASEAHIREAMLRDNTLVLAYVDCAQLCLQAARGPAAGGSCPAASEPATTYKSGQARRAEQYLEKGVTLCRHISEIADVFATKAIAKIHLDILEKNSN